MKAYGLRGGIDPASHKLGCRRRKVIITRLGP